MEEEIKLMIIILLGLCSLWKVRGMSRGASAGGNRLIKGQHTMQEEGRVEMTYEEVPFDIVKTEKLLFPPSPKRIIPNTTKIPYRKCLSGVTFE